MANVTTTKTNSVISNNITLTAGAADTVSASVDLEDGHESIAYIKLTNGATGPTVPAQVFIQLSGDNSNWYDYGGSLVASTANSGIYSWAIEIPRAARRLRFLQGRNTVQNVTCRIEVTEVVNLVIA